MPKAAGTGISTPASLGTSSLSCLFAGVPPGGFDCGLPTISRIMTTAVWTGTDALHERQKALLGPCVSPHHDE